MRDTNQWRVMVKKVGPIYKKTVYYKNTYKKSLKKAIFTIVIYIN
jgi:hypothetical protein